MKYNCHIHSKIFEPDRFLGVITPLIQSNFMLKIMRGIGKAIFFNDEDVFDRYANFLKYRKKTQREIIEKSVKENPKFTLCVKIMDLTCMGAGKVQKDIIEQTKELIELKKDYPILLFPMIDPRHIKINEIYKFIEQNINEIQGVAFYPSIGYTVADPRLERFLRLMNEHKKNVMVHCSPSSPVFYKGDNIEKLINPIRGHAWFRDSKKRKELCGNFAHPYFISLIAPFYKNINFNICHFGGDLSNFTNYVVDYIYRHKNVYTDTSYTFPNPDKDDYLNRLLKIPELKDKVIFGTDEYMDELLKGRKLSSNKLITETNPQKYLHLKSN